jgi:hypothetical protein
MDLVTPEGAIGMKVKWKLYIARVVPAAMMVAGLVAKVGVHASSLKW